MDQIDSISGRPITQRRTLLWNHLRKQNSWEVRQKWLVFCFTFSYSKKRLQSCRFLFLFFQGIIMEKWILKIGTVFYNQLSTKSGKSHRVQNLGFDIDNK